MSKPYVELYYYSRAEDNISDVDIELILQRSQERNARLKISGILVFYNDYFVQCLEGTRTTVNQVFQSISHDSRNKEILLLSVNEVEERAFGDWDMAYMGGRHHKVAYGQSEEFIPELLTAHEIKSLLLTIGKSL
jgi:hypothetical protein